MAADSNVVEALRATDLFASIDRRALDKVASRTKTVHHSAGKQIATEGEGGVGFHLITEGTATVTVGGASRGTIGPGSYFGEISLIDGKPRSATVTTETEVTTLSLVAWEFEPLLLDEPSLTKALLLVMCKRLRAAEDR